MENRDLKLVFDTILSAPGMEESVKIDLRINRKTALFLANAIDKGLDEKIKGNDLLSLSAAVSREELAEIAAQVLEKAGLTEMNRKVKALTGQ